MEKVVFENGLTLVMEKFYNIRSVSAGIYVKNGSLNETAEENGISHFIEHLLFKGTQNRSARDIAVEMDRAGGQLNAYTTKEYTCYYAKILDSYFENAFDVLADMYFNSKFDDAEIVRERGVIDEEIDMYEDTPDDLVHENLQNAVWKGTSLGRPVLGTHNTIANFNSETFKNYMNKNYRPDNTVVSVTGNIDFDKVTELVKKYFGTYKRENTLILPENNNIYIPSVVNCKKEIEQQHICVAFKGISQHSKDSYTMTLLNTILGGSMSSLLFQRIREEKGLAYSIYSYHSVYANSGLFTVYAGFNRENLDKVKQGVLNELFGFADGFNDQNALKNAKQQVINNFLLGLENTSTVMGSIGRTMLIKGRVNTREETVAKIENITMDMVKELAARVFVNGTESISIVG
ncbi:MAG: insulinase family protein [Firmicutes bacterium]|nr:insulinase family protein [Bacillota bacterium]